MATAARAIHCQLPSPGAQPATGRKEPVRIPVPVSVPKPKQLSAGELPSTLDSRNNKIVLQPRLCTLRSYGSDRLPVGPTAMIRTRRENCDEVLPFFETLSEYIESSKKSHDFEIISGRLAMIVFAATVTTEAVTGNSLFRKMDVQGIAEAAGLCLGAVTCAAVFAWFSSARSRVDSIFTVGCNSLIDSLVDQIVDGLFYESELNDWSNEL